MHHLYQGRRLKRRRDHQEEVPGNYYSEIEDRKKNPLKKEAKKPMMQWLKNKKEKVEEKQETALNPGN